MRDVRGTRRFGNVLTTTGARVGEPRLHQLFDRLLIPRSPFGLHVRRIRSANVWTLVPIESEPGEIVDRLLPRTCFDARRIDVLDPQNDSPILLSRRQPSQQIRSRVTKVLRSGWRWSEPAEGGRLPGFYTHL